MATKRTPKRVGKWTPQTEKSFQRWYGKVAKKTGISSNPDDRRHAYNYRRAFAAGATPEINPTDGRYHWPSQFKKPRHPARFIGGADTRTQSTPNPRTPARKKTVRKARRTKRK